MNNIDQKDIEKKWQDIWDKKKVFETKADGREKYFGTVAYPYANSVMHIGHGKTNVTAEIFLRYQRLLGKNVLFPMGFHISGTPVLAVADGIKSGDKKQIKITKEAISEYLDNEKDVEKTLNSFSEPKNIAKFFSSTIEDSLKKVGIGIDWSRKFTTGEPIYNKFIEWQYQKLKDLGILSQGKYPILYSPLDENAVGEDDIKDGDTDKVTIQEMTYILFESKTNKNEFFAVATLRPDALFGTSNLWIDKGMDLLKIKVGKQIWIVGKSASLKIKYQFENVEILSEHKGKEFIGMEVITPLIQREVIVAEANFLDENHGTGIVYSSPAGSPHDYMALVEAKKEGRLSESVKVINTVDSFDKKGKKIEYDGSCPADAKCKKYNVKSSNDEENLEKAKQELYKEEHYGGKLNGECGEFEGIFIKKAKDIVKAKLVELNLGGTLLETSRRAKTRNNDNVIVANLEGQWFLDYSAEDVKQKAYDLLENMKYLPHKLKDTQKGYLEWVSKRPCARKRGLGTPLPFDKEWIIEPLSDSTIYQMLYEIIHIIRRENVKVESLIEDVFDYVYLSKGKIEDVVKKSGINKKIIEEMKNEVDYWQNNDFRYVGQPHMSNHMSFLIYHYALIFDGPKLKKFHPKVGVVGGMLQRNGEKISKSKGNGIPLSKVGKEFGADLYRLYIAVAASFDVVMDFRDDEIAQLKKKFDKWKEIMSLAKKRKVKKYGEFDSLDKWLISRFYSNVKIYFEAMDELKIREAYIAVLYEMLSDMNYHMRRTNEEKTLDVIRFIFEDYLKIMTPATPHICEELFEGIGKNYISLAPFETDIDKFVNKEIEGIEGIAQEIVTMVSRTKETKNIVEIKKVIVVQASEKRFELFDKLKKLLSSTNDFKKIMPELMKNFADDKKFISKFVPKSLGCGLTVYLPKEEERKLIEKLAEFFEKELGAKLEIKNSEDIEANSVSLVPGKPLVLLE
ncbi:MAG: leucine--tRNA ligase [Nanoarchaeota archaeon]|nr:leucine--tRNA ligase [Nanoarchaeota archaeon]